MAAITSANVATAIVKLVAQQALPALLSNLVMGNLVNRDYEPTLQNSGDTINIQIPPANLTPNNVAEAGSVTTQNPNIGSAQIVLDKHKENTFAIPDVTKVLAFPDLLNTYMQPAVNGIAEAVETDLLSLWPLLTANTATGGSSTMDEARIDLAETNLFAAKVPSNEPKFLVVHGTPFGAMRQISHFQEFQMTGQAGVVQGPGITGAGPMGANGTVKGMLVFRSQNVPQSTTFKNIAFHRNALGLAIRRLPQPLPGTGAIAEYAELGNFGMRVVMSYQPNTLAQQFTVDILYGVGVLRNNHANLVLST